MCGKGGDYSEIVLYRSSGSPLHGEFYCTRLLVVYENFWDIVIRVIHCAILASGTERNKIFMITKLLTFEYPLGTHTPRPRDCPCRPRTTVRSRNNKLWSQKEPTLHITHPIRNQTRT